MNYVANGPADNKPASVQIMAWRWSGDKPSVIGTNDYPDYVPTHVSLDLDELNAIS